MEIAHELGARATPTALAFRALAEVRLGRTADARRDLALVHAALAEGEAPPPVLSLIAEVEQALR